MNNQEKQFNYQTYLLIKSKPTLWKYNNKKNNQ